MAAKQQAPSVFQRMRQWARIIKRDVHALYLVGRDPRTPWYVKALALAVACYALSPIDLIPDFIPILGYLDDLIIVPLGILAVVKLTPASILAEHRERSAAAERPGSYWAGGVFIVVWCFSALATGYWLFSHIDKP